MVVVVVVVVVVVAAVAIIIFITIIIFFIIIIIVAVLLVVGPGLVPVVVVVVVVVVAVVVVVVVDVVVVIVVVVVVVVVVVLVVVLVVVVVADVVVVGLRCNVDLSLPKLSMSTSKGDLVRSRRRPPQGSWKNNGIRHTMSGPGWLLNFWKRIGFNQFVRQGLSTILQFGCYLFLAHEYGSTREAGAFW